MPDNTPVYDWPFPVGTDRVADGDNAIEDLALAVEATVQSLVGAATVSPLFFTSGWNDAGEGSKACRFGGLVVLNLWFATAASPAWSAVIGNVPVGWRPAYTAYGWINISTASGNAVAVRIEPDGDIFRVSSSGSASPGDGYVGSATYALA